MQICLCPLLLNPLLASHFFRAEFKSHIWPGLFNSSLHATHGCHHMGWLGDPESFYHSPAPSLYTLLNFMPLFLLPPPPLGASTYPADASNAVFFFPIHPHLLQEFISVPLSWCPGPPLFMFYFLIIIISLNFFSFYYTISLSGLLCISL